jgi:hypothetical protein
VTCTCLLTLIFAAALPAQDGELLYRIDGPHTSAASGGALAGIGDINGDGIGDLLIGGDQYMTYGSASAQVISGADGSVLHTWAGLHNAEAVAAAGDVDGDGTPDVIIGSIWTNFSAGEAQVFSGSTGTLLHTFQGIGGDDYLGNAVAGAGDVNGDGFADLLVGAWGESALASFSGVAYLFSGADGSVLRKYLGQIDHGYFGCAVAGLGDVDGDGVPDQLVGEVGNTTFGYNTGAAYIFSGATGALIHSWFGPHNNSRFGDSLAALEDVDGDGISDCIIAASFQNPTGTAHVYSGATGSLIYELTGYDPDEVFARSVASGGDSDGDGVNDIVVGSDRYFVPGGYTGMARIFSGATGREIQRFYPESVDGRCGVAVCGVGDWNADGLADYAVGAPTEAFNGYRSGSVYILSGQRQGFLFTVQNYGPGDFAIFYLQGGTPQGRAIMAYSLAGGGPTSSPYGELALSPPFQTLPPLTLDALGNGEMTKYLPHAIAGTTIWTQALDLSSGTLSNPHPLRVY